MRRFILLLLFLPIFVIGQSKKSLKETVIQYQDSITILSITTESLRNVISELRTHVSNLEKENSTQKNDKTTLLREKEQLTIKINLLKQEKSSNTEEINSLYSQIHILEDSIVNLYALIEKESFVNDSLKNLKIHNIISLKDLISQSNFSRKNIIGSWDLKTLVLSSHDEYVDFDNIYGYSQYSQNNYNYEADESLINEITFIDPNISIIKLIDGTKITCLFEIVENNNSKYREIINIKFVDTDREELEFTISEYGGAYIFHYNFNSLKYFFDRDDYQNNTNSFRITGVVYEDDWQVFDAYDIDIIGIIK